RYLTDRPSADQLSTNKSSQICTSHQSAEQQSVTNQSPAYKLPAHIRPHIDDEPVDFVRPFIEQGGKRFILVMTHDHSVDFELVRAALDT
ncbi:hypothetical protein, partial [Chryseobacterium sp. SIMBA_029]|uniref:hypothetical protein n=1 Tax=Chryseobacterium sp. SIMBA_029 TaxID=3085772 RepID=UPI00397D01EB